MKKALPRTLFAFGVCVILAILLGVGAFIERVLFYPFPYREIVEREAAIFGADPMLVAAVIREESRFVADSKSHQGAIGLMQLMPSTASSIAESLGDLAYTDESLLIPEINIRYGVCYLADMHRVFSGDTILAIAAYNGGIGRVMDWIDSGRIDPANIRLEDIPFEETRVYVKRVLDSYEKYKRFYNR